MITNTPKISSIISGLMLDLSAKFHENPITRMLLREQKDMQTDGSKWRQATSNNHTGSSITTKYHITPNTHYGVMQWKRFLRYRPFVKGTHRPSVDSPHKGPVTRTLMLFFDVSLNSWINRRVASNLRRHNAQCDVIVMISYYTAEVARSADGQTIRIFALTGSSPRNDYPLWNFSFCRLLPVAKVLWFVWRSFGHPRKKAWHTQAAL